MLYYIGPLTGNAAAANLWQSDVIVINFSQKASRRCRLDRRRLSSQKGCLDCWSDGKVCPLCRHFSSIISVLSLVDETQWYNRCFLHLTWSPFLISYIITWKLYRLRQSEGTVVFRPFKRVSLRFSSHGGSLCTFTSAAADRLFVFFSFLYS